MGKIILLILLPALNLYALRIHSVTVSAVSTAQLVIGLNTEADELYYFHSCQYEVSGHSILVKAYFVAGFGSQLSPLNNTFRIALDMDLPATYRLTVGVYYIDPNATGQTPDLQDEQSGLFFTPLTQTITLSGSLQEKPKIAIFPNPTGDLVHLPHTFTEVAVYDPYGRKVGGFVHTATISLKHLADGLYLLLLEGRQPVRILLQKP